MKILASFLGFAVFRFGRMSGWLSVGSTGDETVQWSVTASAGLAARQGNVPALANGIVARPGHDSLLPIIIGRR